MFYEQGFSLAPPLSETVVLIWIF